MKSIFFPAVMTFGLALSTLHPAHADDLDNMAAVMDLDDMAASLDDMATTMRLHEMDRRGQTYAAAPPRKHHYWFDLMGNRHDCEYDRPIPGLGDLFGAHCP